MTPEQLELLRGKIGHLELEMAKLADEQRLIPRIAIGLLILAIPCYLLWGIWGALGALVFIPCVFGAAVYLIGSRVNENKQHLAKLRADLAPAEAELERAPEQSAA